MDVKCKYKLTGNPEALLQSIRIKVMSQIEALVKVQVNAYLADLEKHMGTISGESGYTDKGISWSALDKETMETSPTFWYESGKAKKSIAVNIQLTDNSIKAFVGVSENSEAYQEVLWNELGFTPRNGDRLIRRPLFIPLAEIHLKELKEKIYSTLGNAKLTVEI